MDTQIRKFGKSEAIVKTVLPGGSTAVRGSLLDRHQGVDGASDDKELDMVRYRTRYPHQTGWPNELSVHLPFCLIVGFKVAHGQVKLMTETCVHVAS